MFSKTLIISAVHRVDPRFVKTVCELRDRGWKLLLYNTGHAEHTRLRLEGVHVIDAHKHMNYYEALSALQKLVRLHYPQIEVVVILHDDTIIRDFEYHKGLISSFLEGDYGFIGCYSHAEFYQRRTHNFEEREIIPIEQKILTRPLWFEQNLLTSSNLSPLFPDPYWAGGYIVLGKDLLCSLEENTFTGGRLFIQGLFKKGAKFGVIKADFKDHPYRISQNASWCTTQFGKGWIHLGDLSRFLYLADGTTDHQIHRIDLTSPYSLVRLGYIATAEQDGVGKWSAEIRERLPTLYQKAGGEAATIREFNNFTSGTCLEL